VVESRWSALSHPPYANRRMGKDEMRKILQKMTVLTARRILLPVLYIARLIWFLKLRTVQDRRCKHKQKICKDEN